MGARTNFELKDANGSVWLYSHWGGDSKMEDLANALEKAEPRWNDIPYGMRIVVSQLIGSEWDSEYGYGISSYQSGEESYEPVCVDFTNKIVSSDTFSLDFSSFVNIYGKHLTNA